jgi:hypothetical protein
MFISRKRNRTLLVLSASLAISGAVACDVQTPLHEISEARHLATDLAAQFAKASGASNLAVLAGADEPAKKYADEARQRAATVEKTSDALRVILQRRDFTDELRLLDNFRTHFAEYRAVDNDILDLAVENTNLKAQRLLFGASEEAVNAMAQSLARIASGGNAKDAWQVRALAANAVGSAREIQALQAPHIAEADDAAMAKIETRMSAAEAAARRELAMLGEQSGGQSKVAEATKALDRLMEVNRQIIHLSRRNSNVRSVALSLNQKRSIVASCEEDLQALQTALSKRGFVGTR